jgi:acetate kinase
MSVAASGLVERIGMGVDGAFNHASQGKAKVEFEQPTADHRVGLKLVLNALQDPATGTVTSLNEIAAIGHRVLHGGELFSDSIVCDDGCVEKLKELIPLGPLHMPANIMGIEACATLMPGVPQVAVFDTAFHQTLPKYAYLYAIPYQYYKEYGIRKYGFHGTSHRYVSGKAMEILGLDPKNSKIITCHLGNGSSIAAIKDGRCIDTSMGLTPLEGLPMGTRSGDIDPTVVSFLVDRLGVSADDMLNVLNKKSGFLGVSELSSDMRDIQAARADGNEKAEVAYQLFIYRLAKYVGSYYVALGGLDAIIFTGGIGENDNNVRKDLAKALECFGVELDVKLNDDPGTRGKQTLLSTAASRVKVLLLPTNEELMIAKDTIRLTQTVGQCS